LRSAEAAVDPVQLLDFMDGYWDGWLPDGVISLDYPRAPGIHGPYRRGVEDCLRD